MVYLGVFFVFLWTSRGDLLTCLAASWHAVARNSQSEEVGLTLFCNKAKVKPRRGLRVVISFQQQRMSKEAANTGEVASSDVAAAAPAVVTPVLDELEQESYNKNGDIFLCQQSATTEQQPLQCYEIVSTQNQPSMLGLEGIIDATLPSASSFYTPSAPPITYENECRANNKCNDVFTSFASLAASRTPSPTIPTYQSIIEQTIASTPPEVMDAAGILCEFKSNAHVSSTIVDMAVDMLTDDKHCRDAEGGDDASMGEEVEEDDVASDSLVHPDRLALDEDSEEVNKLHQYVRKDLLEIFVVPQTASEDSDDEEEDSDDEASSSSTKNAPNTSSVTANNNNATTTRTTRRRSITVPANPPSATEQRYYPGRVGFRCVHCANVRRKSTSKAAFYPLRLKNIYREVCAWQRIHFKKCPHVPDGVRERYDHYKRIDTSRGKVRYWETSARKIGLRNNPDRYVHQMCLHFFALFAFCIAFRFIYSLQSFASTPLFHANAGMMELSSPRPHSRLELSFHQMVILLCNATIMQCCTLSF